MRIKSQAKGVEVVQPGSLSPATHAPPVLCHPAGTAAPLAAVITARRRRGGFMLFLGNTNSPICLDAPPGSSGVPKGAGEVLTIPPYI